MTSDAQIRAFIDRILRLKEEQDTIGEDIRDIYAEAKSMGFDKTAMGNVVAHLRKVAKKGHDPVAEQGAIFDIYLAAYEGNGSHAPAPARTRENIEKFDRETGEILDDTVDAKLVETIAAGVQTEIGRKALIAAVDIMIEREESEERRSDGGLNIVTKHTEIASSAPVERDDEHSAERISPSDDTSGSAGANAGGDDVNGSAERASSVATSSGPDAKRASNSPEEAHQSRAKASDDNGTYQAQEGHGAAGDASRPSVGGGTDAFKVKPPSPLRPHCQRPEACGGYGRNHCHTCLKAQREQAEEVA
jgi:uncharacterized protein (UPF0335 family)